MRRRIAQSVLPSQAAGRATGLAGELSHTSELLLRGRGVPDAGDTTVGALPRPPGVPGGGGGARVGAATRGERISGTPAEGAIWREPTDTVALAHLVAGGVSSKSILAEPARALRAGGRRDRAAALAGRALRELPGRGRRAGRAARCAAADLDAASSFGERFVMGAGHAQRMGIFSVQMIE